MKYLEMALVAAVVAIALSACQQVPGDPPEAPGSAAASMKTNGNDGTTSGGIDWQGPAYRN